MRAATLADAGLIADLLTRFSPEPASVEVVVRQLTAPGLDLARDTRIDHASAGVLAVSAGKAWLDLAGDPSEQLLSWAERSAREQGAVTLETGTWDDRASTHATLEAAGFAPGPTLLRMRVDFGTPFEPVFPAGVSTRTYRDGDAPRIHAVHLAGAATPPVADFEAWAHTYLGPPYFAPDSWFIAEAADELAGILLCSPHPAFDDVALVAVYVVAPSWRGRGVGRALLEHGFATMMARGFSAALLGVDEDNPSPVIGVLAGAGMRVVRRRFAFRKALAPRALTAAERR